MPITLFSQDNYKVEYEKRNFIKLDGKNPEYRLMEEQFSQPSYLELLGNQNKCSLKQLDYINNSQGPTTQMTIVGAEKDLETYFDFIKNEMIVSKDLDGKLFLISSKPDIKNWKITRETKKVSGFNAKKATLEQDGFLYEVWFSPEIKSKCGPDEIFGLPGLVLETKISHIEKPENYRQYKLNQLAIDKNLQFLVPTKGKPISAEEFKKFRAEYDKRLKETYGNNSFDKD